MLRPACQVILFGDEEGTAEMANKLGIQHIPEVERNEHGTPLMRSVFSLAQNVAQYPLVCFVNADIILMSDFLPAVQRLQKHPFLMVGLRWDLQLDELLNFDDAQWEHQLRARLAEHGKLHHHGGGGDYYLFPCGLYDDVPPFSIGRGGLDNWLIYRARSLRVPVIDATQAFTTVHQNHDYSHHPEGAAGVWEGPERKRNIELMGGIDHGFTLDYATRILTPRGLKRAQSLRHLYFRLRAVPVLYPKLHFLLNLFRMFEKTLRRVRSVGQSRRRVSCSE